MLRNKKYVYGGDAVLVPGHLHFGLYMLNRCRGFGGDVALVDADIGESMTYSQLVILAANIALSLTRMGVKKGDVICIFSENRLEYVPIMLGIVCAGATFCAADLAYKGERVLHRIGITKPKIIFCSQHTYGIYKECLKKVTSIDTIIIYGDNVTEEMSFEDFLSPRLVQDHRDFQPIPVKGWKDIALITFSSGTTGLPKAVKMTHLNFISLYQNSLLEFNLIGKSVLATRPFYHSYGLLHSLSALLVGRPLVFTNKNRVEDYLNIIEKLKITQLQLVPPLINAMIKSPALNRYNLSSVKTIVTASMPADRGLLEATKSTFENLLYIIQLYGLTESGSVALNRDMETKIGSVGTPQAGTVFKVVDIATRQPLGPNEHGEICFKGLSLMSGYIGDTSLDYLDDEGFFKTGDIGYYDEDKYFYVVDRIKDMIKYREATLSPAELESILLSHPGVLEAGVAPAKDEFLGEVPVAFVVLKPGSDVSETDLIDYFAERMAKVQLGGVHFVTSLPRGASEKLDRGTLKSMLRK